MTYCTSKGRGGRPSLLTCRLQTSAAILAGFALLCLLKFGLVVAVSAPLASPGLDVAAWIAADYFPLAGAFMLCTHYVVQTYLFWISITVGLRLSLAPGMLLIVLSIVLENSQPLDLAHMYFEFRISSDCSEFYEILKASASLYMAGVLIMYNIWLEERLSRQRLGKLMYATAVRKRSQLVLQQMLPRHVLQVSLHTLHPHSLAFPSP